MLFPSSFPACMETVARNSQIEMILKDKVLFQKLTKCPLGHIWSTKCRVEKIKLDPLKEYP